MRKFSILLVLLMMVGCSTIKYVPVESKTDSIYVEKIVERLDTILVEIPVEVKDIITMADSSHLETSVAISDAWVDSCSTLHHKLVNKSENPLKKEIVYKDRIIEKEVVKEIPVINEVEVPVKYVPPYYKRVNFIFWTLISILLVYLIYKIYNIGRKGWLGRR